MVFFCARPIYTITNNIDTIDNITNTSTDNSSDNIHSMANIMDKMTYTIGNMAFNTGTNIINFMGIKTNIIENMGTITFTIDFYIILIV